MMLVLLGFFGWFNTNYCLEKLSYVFELVGIDTSRHYLIADLNRLMWIYVFSIVTGFVSLLAGVSLEIRGERQKVGEKMTEEELTAKKVIAMSCLTAIGAVGASVLYFIIIFFSYQFTRNTFVSKIIALSVILVPCALGTIHALKTWKKRRNRNQKILHTGEKGS